MPFSIVRREIAKIKVDAVVTFVSKPGPFREGKVTVEPSNSQPAKYLVRVDTPTYNSAKAKESERLLSLAYLDALYFSAEQGYASIAFPLVSGEGFGYPREAALRVATTAIRDHLFSHDTKVYLVIPSKGDFAVGERLLGEVGSYIDRYYVREDEDRLLESASFAKMVTTQAKPLPESLRDKIHRLDEPFSTTLLRLIDARGMSDVEVYKRANLDRKLFSKIRNGKGYMPSKRTAVALAVALELSIDETTDLLRRAGFALSHCILFDVIIEYFITRHRYDIFVINEVLFQFDQPLLGG